jgi:lambda family phage tail tape measure protein
MAGIRVELELSDGSFTSKILHAGESIEQFNRNVLKSHPAIEKWAQATAAAGNSVRKLADGNVAAFTSIKRTHDVSKSFLSTMRDLTIVLGLASYAFSKVASMQSGLVGYIVKTNAEFQRMTMLMKSMSTAVDPMKDAVDQVRQLRDMAKEAPFSLQAIADSAVKIKATGIDPLNGSLRSLMDSVAAFGGSEDSLNRATLAISQMSGKGVIQMEELRQQLGEAIPRATELMARSMGITYGELVQKISTGTVDAKKSLALLFGEFERTFGGSSQRMMGTFFGQMSLLKTQMQNLAITFGNAGFMDAVMKNVRDLNDYLSSNAASVLARDFGKAAGDIINRGRELVDWVIKWKSEIISTAVTMAVAWGSGAVISGIMNIGSALKTTWVEMRRLAAERALAASLTVAGNAASGATGVFVGLRAALAGGATGFMMIGTAVATFAPYLPLLGLAIGGVASYFGLFSSKGEDAIKTLRDFTAASEEELASAKGFAYEKAAQLEKEAKDFEAYEGKKQSFISRRKRQNLYNIGGPDRKAKLDAEFEQEWVENTTKKYEEASRLRGDVEVASFEFKKRQQEKSVRERERMLDDEFSKVQRIYDEESRLSAQKHEENRKLLSEANKTTEKEDLDYKSKRINAVEQFYTDQQKIVQKFIDDNAKDLNSSDQTIAENAKIIQGALSQRWNDLQRQKEAAAAMKIETPTVSKPENVTNLLQKAEQHLERVRSEGAEYRAEMSGAQGEVAKLVYQLKEAQRYGDPTNGKVGEVIEQLITAQKEVSELQDLLKGKDDLEKDSKSVLQKEQEKLFEAEYGHLSDIDKIRMRINQGFYYGQGPKASPFEEKLIGIKERLAESKQGVDNVAKSLNENLFGSQMKNNATGFIGLIDQMNSSWALFRTNVEGTGSSIGNLGGQFMTGMQSNLGAITDGVKSSMKEVTEMFISQGADPKVAAAIVGNFVKESGLNPKSVGDNGTSFGFGQWHNERWDSLKQFAGKMGMTDGNPLAQVRFTMHELTTQYSGVLAAMKNAATPEEAARIFMNGYEKPAKWAAEQSGPGRMQAARDAYAISAGAGVDSNIAKWKASELVNPTNISPIADQDLDKADAIRNKRLLIEANNELAKTMRELGQDTAKAGDIMENWGQKEAEIRKRIKAGDFGSDTDDTSKRYEKLIEGARKADAVQSELDEKKKARAKAISSEEDARQKKEELSRRKIEALARISDPTEQKSSSSLRSYMSELDAYVNAVEIAYGRDSSAYRAAIEEKKNAERNFRATETIEKSATLAEKNRELRRSLLSENTSRSEAVNEEVSQLKRMLAEFKGTAEERVMVEQAVTERIKLLRQEQASAGPIGQQMKQWNDLGKNIEQSMTGWLDGGVDALAEFFTTGKANWKQLAASITKDIVKIMLRYTMSNMFGGGGGKGGAGKAAMSSKGGGAGKMPFAMAHSGGIAGGSLGNSFANPAAFIGAPRYHSGDIIRGLGIGPGEVPIIAKEGEGVFTKEQMRAMGMKKGGAGGQSVSVTSNVTVNANGGSPEQNDDLAKKVSKQVENQMRAVIVDELMKQARPGNFLNSGRR